MKEDIEHFVRSCVKCQSTKSIYKKKYKLYEPLLILREPWENVCMNFMIQLPKWNGMDAILIIVDQFFKLIKMVPTKMIATTFNFGNLFFDMWVKHHEMPQFIIREETSSLWQAFKNICSKKWGSNCFLVHYFTHKLME